MERKGRGYEGRKKERKGIVGGGGRGKEREREGGDRVEKG